MYPTTEGASFDHTYYEQNHVPLLKRSWSPEKVEIDRGISGPYVAAVHVWFKDQDALNAAFGSPALGEIMADVANYTTINPDLQTSEIV